MKTIIVPTDFSKCSIEALEFASWLAKKTGAKLHIINIITSNLYLYAADPMVAAPSYSAVYESYYENIKKVSEKHLEKLTKNKFLQNLDITTKSISGMNIHEQIIAYSDKVKADLIIMGSKGASGVKGILIGSNAERVVRFSHRPVIVIHNKVKNPVFKKIVFASDFMEEAYKIFSAVKNFAEIFNAEILLIKVNTVEQFRRTIDDREKINKFNKHFKTVYKYVLYNDYMKEQGILDYTNEIKADMIAIGTHGKKGLARFLKTDVSEDMVRVSNKPIMVVNFSKKKK